MSHKLIVGTTGACKSLLAKSLCGHFKNAGISTGVLDIMHSKDWQCDFQTENPDEFLQWVKSHKKAMVFVDESGSTIGRYNKEMEFLAIQSRHLGHDCFFIVQGVTQISPIVRDNCAEAIVFACGDSSIRILADDFREKKLLECERLEAGEFFIASRFKQLRRGKVMLPNHHVPISEIEIKIETVSND